MNKTMSLLACVAVFGVGCAGTPATDKALVASCIPTGVRADTCKYSGPPGNPNKAVCHIYVGGNQSTPVVYPYELFVSKGVRNDVTIVWTMMDPEAVFRNNNDGPNLGGNAEFSDGGTTNDPDGNGAALGAASKHYKIKFKNTPSGASHKYSITFKPAGADPVTCDPLITNGGM